MVTEIAANSPENNFLARFAGVLLSIRGSARDQGGPVGSNFVFGGIVLSSGALSSMPEEPAGMLGWQAVVGIGDILAAKYKVEKTLGKGGMGYVVAARHLQLDQQVAIKILVPELTENEDAVARF